MYFIFKIIALLPLWLLQNLALMIAFILNLFNSSIKRITSINIQLAYPDMSATAKRQLVSQSIRSQCLTYIEFIKCWGMPPSYSLSLLKNIYGENILTEALANKKGVIVVVPHFGCWELLNAWLNLYTEPMIMYKPNKNKGINRYLLEAREKFNATLVPTDETGIRAIFKHLKQGGLTVILPDHLPKPSGGIYSNFFGQNTLSITLVSKLAAKTQCNVIGLSCIRQPNLQYFDVHCQTLSDEILSKDLQCSVDALNIAMQDIINQAPEQYIWSYKRFRVCFGNINIYRK
ncbi:MULTISPECIES: lysophospholipid acyltransferase family protein [unclassified Acinetobacter]|uniref:lysophospholipid acyltransferase family protein n=1 Tax=unclassified Acinetobacter TaxID=196816 RepID=UPI0015D1EFF0|nr:MULTISPECIES: lysophospholipid acyltransferase family protein [unclassified Acinetobacter]UUS61306.1 lysophospholipid acyltransferase family protein [Acinetobacter sp. YH16056_T]